MTAYVPRMCAEGGLSGFVLMGFILIVSPVGAETTRLGRLIMLGASTGLGMFAGVMLAVLYWWSGRAAYKKAGGPMTPPTDDADG